MHYFYSSPTFLKVLLPGLRIKDRETGDDGVGAGDRLGLRPGSTVCLSSPEMKSPQDQNSFSWMWAIQDSLIAKEE